MDGRLHLTFILLFGYLTSKIFQWPIRQLQIDREHLYWNQD